MTDTDKRTGPEAGDEAFPEQYEYVEEVVEYKDTRRIRTLLAVILALLALLLAFFAYRVYTAQQGRGGASETTEGMVWLRSIYGWGDAADEQLIAPHSVAIGPDGLIWTNSNNRAAVAFNPDGSFDRILQSNPSASGEPTETAESGAAPTVDAVFMLDVDTNNNLYICDNAKSNILQFSPEATLKQGWSVPMVNGLAANDSRVVAMTQATVGAFDSETGDTYFQFGSRGTGEMQFDSPFGAHIDDDNYVYVADTLNRRVRKFDPEGNLVWDAGTPPDPNNPAGSMDSTAAASALFWLPTGVTTDGNGRVVVTDAFKYQIIVLDGETGEKIASYGDYGAADGLFNNPGAIVYDADRDYFVVADTDNNRLQVVRIEGSSRSPVAAAFRRLFDRPVWICCLPFLILLIAAIVVYFTRRRGKQEEKPADEATEAPALTDAPGATEAPQTE